MTDAERQPDPTAASAADEVAAEAAHAAGAAGDPVRSDPDANVGPATPPADAAEDETLDLEAMAASDPRTKPELLGELLEAESKRDEYLDDLRRSHADFENYRKRVMREGSAQREAGKAAVATPLLEVLDDLDRTLEAASGSSDPGLSKGIELVAEKLVKALQGAGLERLDETGVPFDPTRHEAVQQVAADEPRDEPVVSQVLRPGYCLGDKILRAAMVVVEQ